MNSHANLHSSIKFSSGESEGVYIKQSVDGKIVRNNIQCYYARKNDICKIKNGEIEGCVCVPGFTC